MAKKNALGRGLGALIEDADKEKLEKIDQNYEIALNKIELNPFQPRTHFDESALDELAASIRELGIIQPLTVREVEKGRFQLIAGERRLRAARLAGLKTVPAFIRTADDQALLELALVENIQREDLDAVEVAISYQRLIEECNLTQEQLSTRVGKQRSTVANYLRLLRLPAEIQLGIRKRELSMGHARALVNVDDPQVQLKVYYKVLEEELSVRKTEEMVRALPHKVSKPSSGGDSKTSMPEEYRVLSEQISEKLKLPVQFKINEKGKGRLVLPFENSEQMERILAVFRQGDA